MRSGDFPPTAAREYSCAMASQQITSQSRADDSADLARVLVALGLLALLASFDGAADEGASAPTAVEAAADQSR